MNRVWIEGGKPRQHGNAPIGTPDLLQGALEVQVDQPAQRRNVVASVLIQDLCDRTLAVYEP